ncbi:hypothetical protein QUA56_28510 [Microcoleus sp. N3A4]|uniref:hypothetical protein n=1 Tax=Microcoleus sp. N3A4 TaxID=3055379 RepID=UPI003B150C6A
MDGLTQQERQEKERDRTQAQSALWAQTERALWLKRRDRRALKKHNSATILDREMARTGN